jgi:ribosome biogenesis GTPase / thiamine phosphate phosphatase
MSRQGTVVARHRRHVTVEDASGQRRLCRTAQRRLQPIVADEVLWRAEPDGTGTVTAVLERRSTLTRVDSRGRCELVAANLTQLVAVAAFAPAPDWFVVDHYLAAAELAGLSALLVMNKADIGTEAPAHLDCYRRAGYALHETSAAEGLGLTALAAALQGERSVMVGQSGVGKSSLLNALLGKQVQSTGNLTGKGAHGRHTTSSAVLYRLAEGGELVDSPGVRAYAPYIGDPAALHRGFPEIRELIGRCRFDNCRHLAEPGCAVKGALDTGGLCARRYESYTRLYELTVALHARR